MFKVPKNTAYRHLFIWICLIILIAYGSDVEGKISCKIVYILFFTFNFILTYYLLLFFSFSIFSKKKYLLFAISFTFVIVLFISVDYIHFKKNLPFLGATTSRGDLNFANFINNSLLLFSFAAISSLATFLRRDAFGNSRNLVIDVVESIINH